MIKRKHFLIFSLLLSAALFFCACGNGAGRQETAETADTALTENPSEQFPGGVTEAQTERETAGTASPEADVPQEDPWAEGYFYDETLTAQLFALFATETTNNTDENSVYRTMTGEHLARLDAAARDWLIQGIADSETEESLLAMHFRFTDDPPETQRGLRSVRAGIYSLNGRDAETLRSRILLGNTEACFYLYLRVYYNPELDRSRIYLINGLVW